MVSGFAIVFLAGLLQGTFMLPMALTRKWHWEHTWMTFSVAGMLLLNWLIAAATMPRLIQTFRSAPVGASAILMLFGFGWGIGAVLFGLGMKRLGMALGYPIIMGLIACLGSLIPLAVFFPQQMFTSKGYLLLGGAGLLVSGIALCSTGGLCRQSDLSDSGRGGRERRGSFAGALLIGILAGILSCLPNVGIAFGGKIINAAIANGAAPQIAPSAVFVLFFTVGGFVNCIYCAWAMYRGAGGYFGAETARNIGLAVLMAALWIGSFHLYGIGSRLLESWGLIVGWPLFICVSIGTGVLWGLWRGEWRGLPARARRSRNWGIGLLFIAVVTISMTGLF